LRAAARCRQASKQEPSSIMVLCHGQPLTEKKAAFRLTLVKDIPSYPFLSRPSSRASQGRGAR
jgi:hypothetical protein